MGRTGRRVSFP